MFSVYVNVFSDCSHYLPSPSCLVCLIAYLGGLFVFQVVWIVEFLLVDAVQVPSPSLWFAFAFCETGQVMDYSLALWFLPYVSFLEYLSLSFLSKSLPFFL
jgi:hypothetical protein